MNWQVYMLECADGSFYTGVTNKGATQRLWEHNHSPKGAKYTRSHRPCQLVYSIGGLTRSGALQREAMLKKFSHAEKKRWCLKATA